MNFKIKLPILFILLVTCSLFPDDSFKKSNFGVMGSFTYLIAKGDKSYVSDPYVDGFGSIQFKTEDRLRNKAFVGLTGYFKPWNKTNKICEPIIFGVTIGVNEASESKGISYLMAVNVGFVLDDDLMFTITHGGFYDKVTTMQYPYYRYYPYPYPGIRKDGSPEAIIANANLTVPTRQIDGWFSGWGVTVSKSLNFLSSKDQKDNSSEPKK